MKLENMRAAADSDQIILYWDKPEEPGKQYEYEILRDGMPCGRTNKTHFTLTELAADTEYMIRIEAYERDDRETKQQCSRALSGQSGPAASESMLLSTGRQKEKLDITKAPYFAKGDGSTMDTAAIQRTVDDCGRDQMVYIPEGIFLTGALRLHSDMELYLEEGAVLQGTQRVEDYLPRIPSRFEGLEMECYSSLLNMGQLSHEDGYHCKNVVIRGKGTIASGGRALAENVIASEKERLKEYMASLGEELAAYEKPDTIPGRVRPRLINMSNCQNIRISGLTLKNGASWNVHMIYSDEIVTNDCTFYSQGVWNGDGWDPDSSTNCTIFGCTFYTGDDSIAIKSGKNPEGNVINRPSAHIRIFDCKCASGHGITMGSEMSGGIHDVRIWDCDLSCGLYGIEIKGTRKRGGYVRDVQVRDCKVARILFHSVAYNDDGQAAPVPPVFEKCRFQGIHITGEYLKEGRKIPCRAIELCGFDRQGHRIRDIVFEDITIDNRGEEDQTVSMKYCENITFKGVTVL